MRCRHHEAIFYEEVSGFCAQKWIENGILLHNLGEPDITGKVRVYCPDCGMDKIFDRYALNCPQWLIRAMQILATGQDDDEVTADW